MRNRKIYAVGLVLVLSIICFANAVGPAAATPLNDSAMASASGAFGCGTLAGATVAATVFAAVGGISLLAAAIGGIGFALFC